jgi:hypothetical protein
MTHKHNEISRILAKQSKSKKKVKASKRRSSRKTLRLVEINQSMYQKRLKQLHNGCQNKKIL